MAPCRPALIGSLDAASGQSPPHIYASRGFDRAAKRRIDAAWLAQQRADPSTRVLLMSKLELLIARPATSRAPMLHTVAELGRPLPEEAMFLGDERDCSLFAADLGCGPPGGRYVELRTVGATPRRARPACCAYARGARLWHSAPPLLRRVRRADA